MQQLKDSLQQAIQLHQGGQLEEAERQYNTILSYDPQFADAWHLLGVIRLQQKQYTDAIGLFERALAIKPKEAMYLQNMGAAKKGIGDLQEARRLLTQSLHINPNAPEAQFNLGSLLVTLKEYAPALILLEKVLRNNPSHGKALTAKGTALTETGQYNEAFTCFEKALRVNPQSFEVYDNLGLLYRAQQKLPESVACFQKAISLNPTYFQSYYHLAYVLYDAGKLSEALHVLNTAIQRGDAGEANYHKATILMLQGNMTEGAKLYEARWTLKTGVERPFHQPRWQGQPLTGKTLLVWGEQGIGDELMFASLLPDIYESCGKLVIECNERLVALLSRSFPNADIVALANPSPLSSRTDIDYQVPMGDLMRYVSPRKEYEQGEGYLQADESKVAACRQRYAEHSPGLRVGISWHSINPHSGAVRSQKLEDWLPLLKTPGVVWYDLQYGDHSKEVRALAKQHGITIVHDDQVDAMTDMDGFAAQAAAMDLVISVANSTVHMAGSLGVPVWVLTPFVPSWRWQLNREDSIWYSHIRLFRQQKPGDWSDVLSSLQSSLREITG